MRRPDHRSPRTVRRMVALACVFAALVGTVSTHAADVEPARERIESLERPLRQPPGESDHAEYDLTDDELAALVRLPAGFDPNEPHGLIVLIPAQRPFDATPAGWGEVLDRHGVILVSPQAALNFKGGDRTRGVPTSRRIGMAVAWTTELMHRHRIDRERVYAAGLSGGARIASQLGLFYPGLYAATLQCCGSDFPRPVPRVHAEVLERDRGGTYGVCAATPEEIEAAREKVHFTIVTGPGDFRRGHLRDIYDGGFKADGFSATLLDLPEMKHELCPPAVLDRVLSGHP
jgi:dienelactone hydrolase